MAVSCQMQRWGCVLAVCLIVVPLGCSSHIDRLQSVRHDFFANQLGTARANLQTLRTENPREADVFALDEAMLELAEGHPAEAERQLRRIRDKFDHLSQTSVTEEATSLVTDDTYRAYSGEDYEQVLIRVMLTISSLMHGGEDAQAYALQVTEKQQEFALARQQLEADEQVKAAAYQQIALGPYVRAAIAEESPLTLNEAVRARVQVAEFAPDFSAAKPDIQRAEHEIPIPPGEGVLYVFAFVGQGPVKVEENAIATQAALFIADRIVSAVSKYDVPPTIAPVKIPRVKTTPATGRFVTVSVAGKPMGQTETLIDIGQLAKKQQEAHETEIIARAVARRVLKKGAIYMAKDALDVHPVGSLAMNIAGVAWEATENADVRCWGLLPDRIQVLRLPLPAGEHEVTLQSSLRGSPAGTKVVVPEGRNVYLLGQFPDSQLVGELVISNQVSAAPRRETAAAVPVTVPAPESAR